VTSAPEHQVIWIARDGAEAVELCAKHTPDLVLMDLIMPVMDGVEATRRIMASTPCSILIVTVSVQANSGRVFEAMGHGALDAIDTPTLGSGDVRASAARLLSKINSISRISDSTKIRTVAEAKGAPQSSRGGLVAIGASAGGPSALAELLAGLPRDFAAALVIIQHVDERFTAGLADWLGGSSALPVRLAREGDRAMPGTVLLAGTGDHLTLKGADRLGYTSEPADYAYRPSVDVFFHSVGKHWPGKAIGVLLTGMGSDGASGLKALRAKGHYTIAQDKASSAVYGMPKAAAAADAAVDILPLKLIAGKLVDALAVQGVLERMKQ
jgi:two-component system response regulator WspF